MCKKTNRKPQTKQNLFQGKQIMNDKMPRSAAPKVTEQGSARATLDTFQWSVLFAGRFFYCMHVLSN